MSPLKKFLFHSTAYTVAISMLFFVFAAIVNVAELRLSFSRYFTIFAFGLVCSASEFLLVSKKLTASIRYIIHYLSLGIAFFVVFLTVRNSDGRFEFNAASMFASFVIFSCFYAIIMTAVIIYKKKKTSKESIAKNVQPKEKYKSKFGG